MRKKEKKEFSEAELQEVAQQIGRDLRPILYFIAGFWLYAALSIWAPWTEEENSQAHESPQNSVESPL